MLIFMVIVFVVVEDDKDSDSGGHDVNESVNQLY